MNKRIIIGLIIFILLPFILISCDLSGYCGIFYGGDEDCPFLYGRPELIIDGEVIDPDGSFFMGELPHSAALPEMDNYIEKEVTLKNIGTDLLYINHIGFYDYNNAFSVIFPPELDINQPIEEEGEIYFTIRYTPAVKDEVEATFEIFYQEKDEEQRYSYQIGGKSRYPEILMTVKDSGEDITDIKSYKFEKVHINQPKETVFVLKNVGNYELNLNSIALLDANLFEMNYETSITTLAPDEEMEVNVSFSPKEIGSYRNTLNIESNTPISPFSVELTGTGVEYDLVVDSIHIDNLDGQEPPYNDDGEPFLVKPNDYEFRIYYSNTGKSDITEPFNIGLYLIEDQGIDSEVTPNSSKLAEFTIDSIGGSTNYQNHTILTVIPRELKLDISKKYKLAAIIDTEGNIPETTKDNNHNIPDNIYVYNQSQDSINSFSIKKYGILFVDDGPDADDSNSGLPNDPLATIQGAINRISGYSFGEIRLFEGVYEYDQTITVVDNISIRGGFDPDNPYPNPSSYDYTNFPSIVRNVSNETGASDNPVSTIKIDHTVTDFTIIEGLYIEANDTADYSAGVFIENNVSGFSNLYSCNILSGSGNSQETYGIYIKNSYSYFNDITINDSTSLTSDLPGQSSSASYGIYINGGALDIEYSNINGGYGSYTYGIYSSSTYFTGLYYNRITGNYNKTATLPNTINNSYGVYSSNITANLEIVNNLIYGSHRTVNNAIGIYSEISTPQIANNTIYTGVGSTSAYGISNSNIYSSTNIINNIIFSNGGTNTYDINGGDMAFMTIMHNNLFDVENSISLTNNTRNVSVDLVDNSGVTYFESFDTDIVYDNLRLKDDTPIAVRKGGSNLNASNNYEYIYDFAGNSRTPTDNTSYYHWSMGAYENDSDNTSGSIEVGIKTNPDEVGNVNPESIEAIPNLEYYITCESPPLENGYNFSAWTSSDGIIEIANPNNNVTWINFIDADSGDHTVEITANYDLKKYSLYLETSGSGQIDFPEQTEILVSHGEETEIIASPSQNYGFHEWTTTDIGVLFGNTNSAETVVILEGGDATITANFLEIVTINLTINGGSAIDPEVIFEPPPINYNNLSTHITANYLIGTEVTLEATPMGDFDNWGGDIPTNSDNPISITVNSDISIVANFY